MKLIFLSFFLYTGLNLFGQNVEIPDINFKTYLLGNKEININEDREIQLIEATSFTGYIDCSNLKILSLKGIESFTNLASLYCNDNEIEIINISHNKSLSELECRNNKISSLDLTENQGLESLNCADNFLSNLNLSKNSNLGSVLCQNNKLTQIDLSNNPMIKELACQWNKLDSLDVSKCPKLKRLDCNENNLTLLDVEKNTELKQLFCNMNPLECVSKVPMFCKLEGAKRCDNSFEQIIDANETNFLNDGNRNQIVLNIKLGMPINGIVKFPNGELRCVEGKIVLETMFYKNKNIKLRWQLKDGYQQGLQEFYFRNGNKKLLFYIDTKIYNPDEKTFNKKNVSYTKLWNKEYFKNGQLKKDTLYKDGYKVDQICYNKKGKCIKCR